MNQDDVIKYIINIFELKQKYLLLNTNLLFSDIKIYDFLLKKNISINIKNEMINIISKLINNNFDISYHQELNKISFNIPFISKRYKIQQIEKNRNDINDLNIITCPTIVSECSFCHCLNGLCNEHLIIQKKNTNYYKYYEIKARECKSLINKVLYNIMTMFGRFHTSICISDTDEGHIIKLFKTIQNLNVDLENYLRYIKSIPVINIDDFQDMTKIITINNVQVKIKNLSSNIKNKLLTKNRFDKDNKDFNFIEYDGKYTPIYDTLIKYFKLQDDSNYLKYKYLNNENTKNLENNLELLLEIFSEDELNDNINENTFIDKIIDINLNKEIIKNQKKIIIKLDKLDIISEYQEIYNISLEYISLLSYNLPFIIFDHRINKLDNILVKCKQNYLLDFIKLNKFNYYTITYLNIIIAYTHVKYMFQYINIESIINIISFNDCKMYMSNNLYIFISNYINNYNEIINNLLSIDSKYYSHIYEKNLITSILNIKLEDIFKIDDDHISPIYQFQITILISYLKYYNYTHLESKIKLFKNVYNELMNMAPSILIAVYNSLLNYYLSLFLLLKDNDNYLIDKYIDNLLKLTITYKLLLISDGNSEILINKLFDCINEFMNYINYSIDLLAIILLLLSFLKNHNEILIDKILELTATKWTTNYYFHEIIRCNLKHDKENLDLLDNYMKKSPIMKPYYNIITTVVEKIYEK